jgi:outer membrane protein TolC
MQKMNTKIPLIFLLPGFLAGCAQLVPEKNLPTPTRESWHKELAEMAIEPITGPMTLDQAIARGLKYNLDRRAKQLEQEIASGQFETALQDMLPKARAQLDRSRRSDERITRNANGTAGSTASDRNHTVQELGVSWSLLEFGVGYYTAKQSLERIHIANERRRKLSHTLIQDVRSAYWRAACAQIMREDLRKTIAQAEKALEDARKIESERIRAPGESLTYQKQLLESLRTLELIDQELAPALVELATLINAPKGQPLTLAPQWPDLHGQMNVSMEALEAMALENNADLREVNHQSRIARDETRKVMARMFPNLSFYVAAKYDTDSYQVHRSWDEASFQLSFNLMNLFTGPSQMRLAEAGVALADQRRMVMQMAVITQVHLGRLNWLNAQKQSQRADQIWAVDDRLAKLASAREQALMRGSLETVQAQASALLSQFRRYQAVAQVQVAESRLRSVIGLEFDESGLDKMSLESIAQKVSQTPSMPSITATGKPHATR